MNKTMLRIATGLAVTLAVFCGFSRDPTNDYGTSLAAAQ